MTKVGKIGLSIVIIIILVLVLGFSSAKKGSEPIKIGFVGPLTGDASAMGSAARASVEVATDEINKAGGINGRQVEVIYEDGKCSPTPATNAAQKLVNVDKVSAIVGGLCSSETSAFVGLAGSSHVPTISYCSSAPSLSASGSYFFRTYPSDAYQGKFAAEYAYNTLKARNISVLYHVSDWGTGIKDVFVKRFIELGGTIAVTEGAPQTARDYKTQLVKMKAANPDYLYMPLYPEGALVAVEQAQNLGLKTKILAADAWGDTKLITDVNKNADILYVGSADNQTPEFVSKILAKTGGQQVPTCAPQAYDAMQVLTTALKQAGVDGDALQKAIRTTNIQGVSGPIQFDSNGDVTSAKYVVKRIANGLATEVK